jgi:hypothetical protein
MGNRFTKEELQKNNTIVNIQYNLKILFKPTNYFCAQYRLQGCHNEPRQDVISSKGAKI